MNATLNIAVQEACKRMHTRPSMLGKTAEWFAKTMSPHNDPYTNDPDLWLEVFLKLGHDVQLELLNDERERTKKKNNDHWNLIKPAWQR